MRQILLTVFVGLFLTSAAYAGPISKSLSKLDAPSPNRAMDELGLVGSPPPRLSAPEPRSGDFTSGQDEAFARLQRQQQDEAAQLAQDQQMQAQWEALEAQKRAQAETAFKAHDKDKAALVSMAKADKRSGVTTLDMRAYQELNRELADPFPPYMVRIDEGHPNRGPHAQVPHGHVGPIDYIPIKDLR